MITPDFFTDPIHITTHWLYAHPCWALIFTFLIALAESLAIIGSIIPGSITMTTVGILAGSGVMRIDLTFSAAILGAIVGDGLSYLLGYYFSDHLINKWPFRRYPQWLGYGERYFERHGGKSVLIGRFIGPLRSIIPVIAGMMKMNRWHFFFANTVSAVGWSILYVLPGILIGTAGNELPPQKASHLFFLVLSGLIGLWIFSLGVKWVYIRLSRYLRLRELKNPSNKSLKQRRKFQLIVFILSILVFFSLIVTALFYNNVL
ncbi:MAG: DedA family protein [Legionella sp.]|nr:DedA family protein [Legionella sp.]